jgi:hypothetical protein
MQVRSIVSKFATVFRPNTSAFLFLATCSTSLRRTRCSGRARGQALSNSAAFRTKPPDYSRASARWRTHIVIRLRWERAGIDQAARNLSVGGARCGWERRHRAAAATSLGFVPVAPAFVLRIPLVSVDDSGHPRWGPVQTDARQCTVPSCRIACLSCRQRPPGPTEPLRAWRTGCRRRSVVPNRLSRLSNHCPNPSRRDGMPTPDGFDWVTTLHSFAAFAPSHRPDHERAGFANFRSSLSCSGVDARARPFPGTILVPVCLLQGGAADAQ